MINRNFLFLGLIIAIFVFYWGGSGSEKKQEQALVQTVEKQLVSLQQALDAKQVRNAVILSSYASAIKEKKPQMAELADTLAKDAASSGPAVSMLKDRLQKVKDKPNSVGNGSYSDIMEELTALSNATLPGAYNDQLTDSINVLADMSEGSLPRINAPRTEEGGAKPAPGSQLVGNPQYGHWTQRNGMSFWEWYGAYALFRDLVSPNYYNYDSWRMNRPWSYYNDYGRSFYGSVGERRSFDMQEERATKTYGAGEGRRASSFGKSNPYFTPGTPNINSSSAPSTRRTSSFSSGGSYGSSYGGSVRSSSRSRSSFGGGK